MSRFELRTEKIHADWWDDDEYVTVKERTWADDQRIATAGLSNLNIPQSRGEAQRILANTKFDALDSEKQNVETMLASIAAWSLKDDSGKVAPLDRKHIRMLPKRDGEFIMEGIERLNPTRDESFPGDRGDGVPDGEGEVANGDE